MTQQVDERVAFLRQLPFFKDMLLKELAAVGFRCRMKSFAKDALILAEGMPGKGLFIIRRGVVNITKRGASGEKIINRLKEPDFFGEMSLLENAPVSASVIAADDCDFLVLEPQAFGELLANDQTVGIQMLLVVGRVMAHRMRRGNQEIYGML